MFTEIFLTRDMRSLESARSAWMALAPLRQRRARHKAFTYGRQWGDACRTPDGRTLTEGQRITEEGRVPITNNIIRRTVKSIIGRYRYMCRKQESEGEASQLPSTAGAGMLVSDVSETDARALEEFLISGCVIQYLSADREPENVSPERFFFHEFSKGDGSDCRLLGRLTDMGTAEILKRFGDSDPRKARAVKEALRRSRGAESPFPGMNADTDFSTPSRPGTHRVVELWRIAESEYLSVEDPASGRSLIESPDALERLEGLNRARAEVGSPLLKWTHGVEERWEGVWLTSSGEILGKTLLSPGARPPFAMKFYPMIDGEIHSLVEDVIDQQKHVNRLISLLDHIISSSAKGVLLYPADQLPDGFTWKDLRRIWSNPMGILPFKRTAKGMMPQQVNASGTGGEGATEMLRMQLRLFDEISGASGALRGSSGTAAGEGMLRAELENAMVSMLDVLASFRAFVLERDAAAATLRQQFNNPRKTTCI